MKTEELLSQLFAVETSATDKARIETEIMADAEGTRALRAWRALFDASRSAPTLRAPAHAKRRWQQAIDQELAIESRRYWRFALAASVVIGLAMGIRLLSLYGLPRMVSGYDAPAVDLSRAAQAQLIHATAQLPHFAEAGADAQRDLVLQWLQQNRALARAAEAQGDLDLARALRALEPTLAALLVTDEAAFAAASNRLAFEWKLTQTKVAAQRSNQSLDL